jgi:outer membrane protein assembly factor BamD
MRLAGVLALPVVLLLGGCSYISDILRPGPQALTPAADLYAEGEKELGRQRYEQARTAFRRIVERHPNTSYAVRARFLIGESYYREGEFDKAVKEFEGFLAFYPRNEIADLAQYRLAMSYYDQMKPVEQDQSITVKAIEAFQKLAREYPDSRYASDALAKVDVCRSRLAQKDLWIAVYYLNQGNRRAARERLEAVLKDYPQSLVVPEAMFRLAEVYAADGRTRDAQERFQFLANNYAHSEWGRRAAERLRTAAR